MHFATPRYEYQTHTACQITQPHRNTQAPRPRCKVRRRSSDTRSVRSIARFSEFQSQAPPSPGYRPASARLLLRRRPLVGPCVWPQGRLLQQHPLGQSSTHVEGYNSPKVAAQTIVYATAQYCQVKGKRQRVTMQSSTAPAQKHTGVISISTLEDYLLKC